MSNFSLGALKLGFLLDTSPALQVTVSMGRIGIIHSKFVKSFRPVLISTSNAGVSVSKSAFNSFISSVLIIEDKQIYNKRYDAFTNPINLTNCEFLNIMSDECGGAIQSFKHVDLECVNFNNITGREGGCVVSTSITAKRCSFENCRAVAGAAICTRTGLPESFVHQCLFKNQTAERNGCIYKETHTLFSFLFSNESDVVSEADGSSTFHGGENICLYGTVQNTRGPVMAGFFIVSAVELTILFHNFINLTCTGQNVKGCAINFVFSSDSHRIGWCTFVDCTPQIIRTGKDLYIFRSSFEVPVFDAFTTTESNYEECLFNQTTIPPFIHQNPIGYCDHNCVIAPTPIRGQIPVYQKQVQKSVVASYKAFYFCIPLVLMGFVLTFRKKRRKTEKGNLIM